MRQKPTMIDAWEDKMAKLSAEYGEVISAKMKVAVLYAMRSELARRQRIGGGGDRSEEHCEVQA